MNFFNQLSLPNQTAESYMAWLTAFRAAKLAATAPPSPAVAVIAPRPVPKAPAPVTSSSFEDAPPNLDEVAAVESVESASSAPVDILPDVVPVVVVKTPGPGMFVLATVFTGVVVGAAVFVTRRT